jgi:hypothetical protein
MVKRVVTIITLSSCLATALLAKSPPASSPTLLAPTQPSHGAPAPAQRPGVFAYPSRQQTPVVFLLSPISGYSASKRNEIDPDPVIGLMRAEAPRCAVVCGMSCIRPWAPFNDTPFPMPDGGGLFECLRSGPVTPHPAGASSKPLLQDSVTYAPQSAPPRREVSRGA